MPAATAPAQNCRRSRVAYRRKPLLCPVDFQRFSVRLGARTQLPTPKSQFPRSWTRVWELVVGRWEFFGDAEIREIRGRVAGPGSCVAPHACLPARASDRGSPASNRSHIGPGASEPAGVVI